MNNIKLNSISSSYLELFKPSSNNLKKDKLLIGTLNNNSSINKFYSIINFKYENINISKITSAYLYIYLDDIIYSDFPFKNIVIHENLSDLNLKEFTFENPPIKSENHIDSCLPFNFAKHYVSIDITSLYKNSNNKNYFSIVIDSPKNKATSVLKIHSVNSQNPPYIILNLKDFYKEKTIEKDNSIKDINFFNESNLSKKHDYDKILSELALLNKKFNELKKRLDEITIEPIEFK